MNQKIKTQYSSGSIELFEAENNLNRWGLNKLK